MYLIAWPRTQLENNAVGGLYKRGDNSRVFVSDEITRCA